MANDSYSRLHAVFGRWWRGLNDSDDSGQRGEEANRGDIARLRRVSTFASDVGQKVDVATALTIGALRDLYRRLHEGGVASLEWEERLVVAAVTLAHVRKDVAGSHVAQLLAGANSEQPVMAESRFLRLMRVRTPAELMDEGRRVAALLKSGAPVADLGASLMVWLDDPSRRRIWAQAYYGLNTPTMPVETTEKQRIELGV